MTTDELKIRWALAVLDGDYHKAGELAFEIQTRQNEVEQVCARLWPGVSAASERTRPCTA